jgi:tRNA (cmo5U34)-methyltransferase
MSVAKHPRNPFVEAENSALLAAEYEVAVRRFVPGYEAIFSMAQAFFELSLPERAEVLIVGAGGGMELVAFGQSPPHWRFVGVDPSEKMVEAAQAKMGRHGLTERVELIQGYVQDLPETKMFDGATCILVMHFLPDDGAKRDLLKNIAARLKPQARFILVDGCEDVDSDRFKLFFRAFLRRAERMGATAEQIEHASQNTSEFLHLISEERVLELLQEASFGDVYKFYTGLWFRGWLMTRQ